MEQIDTFLVFGMSDAFLGFFFFFFFFFLSFLNSHSSECTVVYFVV